MEFAALPDNDTVAEGAENAKMGPSSYEWTLGNNSRPSARAGLQSLREDSVSG